MGSWSISNDSTNGASLQTRSEVWDCAHHWNKEDNEDLQWVEIVISKQPDRKCLTQWFSKTRERRGPCSPPSETKLCTRYTCGWLRVHFLKLFFGDPHILEGLQWAENASTDPERKNYDIATLDNCKWFAVPEGPNKPYLLKGRGVMIRRGSSDRLMTRVELDAVYNEKRTSHPYLEKW